MRKPYNRVHKRKARTEPVRCNLRRLRIGKGHSQYTLAQQAGVTALTIANYEHGRTRPDVREIALAVSAALGVPMTAVWPDAETFWPRA